MTATPPVGLEHKTTAVAAPAGLEFKAYGEATGVSAEWGSDYPAEHGVRNAIVAVTGIRDEVGDIIVPGFFTDTLKTLEPKMCLGHDWNRFVGIPVAYEELLPGDPRLPRKDRFGKPWPAKAGALVTRNKYLLDTPDGQKAWAEVEFLGNKAAFSIGYVPDPEHTHTAVDPDTGLLTRFLGKGVLYEYGPVLHGANTLAGVLGNKSAQPLGLEGKVRLVRDSAFWGLPIGTPIRLGMKPSGPKARRLERSGKPVPEGAGAVEIDQDNLRIKPTAKGKQRSGKDKRLIFDLVDQVQGLYADELDPFDDAEFQADDTDDINKGETYNPLDLLVANGVVPADLEEWLRGSDWDEHRLGDAEEQQDQIDGFIGDVTTSYREKYQRELVKQNADNATEEVPSERGDDPEVDAQNDADTAAAAEAEANKPAEQPTKLATDLKPGDKIIDSDSGNTVTVSSAKRTSDNFVVVDGEDDEGNIHHSVAQLTSSYKVPADTAEQAPVATDTPVEQAPQQPAESAGPATGRAIAMEDGRTLQSVEPEDGEVQAFELASGGATLRVFEDAQPADPNRRWGFRTTAADGTVTEGPQNYRSSGSALVLAEDRFADLEGDAPEAGTADTPDVPDAPEDASVGAQAPAEPYVATGNMNAPEDMTPEQLDIEIEAAKELQRELRRRKVPSNSAQLADAKMRQRVFQDEKRKREQANPVAPQQEAPQEPSTEVVPDGAPEQSTQDNPLAALDDMALETELTESRRALSDLRKRNNRPGVRPNTAAEARATERMNLAEAEVNRRQDAGADENQRRTDELIGGNRDAAAVTDADGNRWVREDADGLMYPEDAALRQSLGGAPIDELAIDHGPLTPEDGGDATAPDDTVAPPTSAEVTRMVSLPKQQAATEAAAMTDAQLAAYDDRMAERAATLGKPGQRTPAHEAIAAERSQRPAPAPGADDGQAALDGPPAEATAENSAILTAEDMAEAEETGDASFGITEAPDGEFEADPDVADRQDRISALLIQDEAGSLDLSGQRPEELRQTRADVVTEIRLQEHLATRDRRERPVTRTRRDTAAADAAAGVDDSPAAAEGEPAGPKPRPGVAGAAEDLADALDDGDEDRITAARARLDSSLKRSRSDSDQVAALRAVLDGDGDPGVEDLRAAADAIRVEQRAKRNETARARRTVRRLERERLRSLLGRVEAEMRNRNMDFDPAPDLADTDGEPDVSGPAPAWQASTIREDWSGSEKTVTKLGGVGYAASITDPGKDKPVDYTWATISEDGNTLASGSGSVVDTDAAKAAVEVALQAQYALGLMDVDSMPPTSSIPVASSATPDADRAAAVTAMRDRIATGRKVNPLTGRPDPFATDSSRLIAPSGTVFDDPQAVRTYLEASPGSANVNLVRWDTAKMSPGGAFLVVDDLQGKPNVMHTVTGGWINPPDRAKLNRGDMMRYAAILESNPDVDGQLIDWSLTREQGLMDGIKNRSFPEQDNSTFGMHAVQESALDVMTAEKLRTGGWTHPLVVSQASRTSSGLAVTNHSQREIVLENTRALGFLLNTNRGKPSVEDRKTLELTRAATTLDGVGAPDAAAVLLSRRAEELRATHGADADARGAAMLETISRGYLGMYSPEKTPGDRVTSIKPGERIHFTVPVEGGEPTVRSFRALSTPRRSSYGYGPAMTPVIDEDTGSTFYLQVDGGAERAGSVRISEEPQNSSTWNSIASERLDTGAFVVTGPGEETPATGQDVLDRSRSAHLAIPQDVLDSAAEALPETTAEATARRNVTPAGTRAPRRASAAAPRRTAPAPAPVAPVRNEEMLAVAQGRGSATLLGMPFELADAPVSSGFGSVDEVRTALAELQAKVERGQAEHGDKIRTSPRATIDMIDKGGVALSPGGHFLVYKRDGYVVHAGSGLTVYPSTEASRSDMMRGGQNLTQAVGLRIADALERGTWDGERADWSGEYPYSAVRKLSTMAKDKGRDPIATAGRFALTESIRGNIKPRPKDAAMVGGVAGVGGGDAPNPELLTAMSRDTHVMINRYELLGGRSARGYAKPEENFTADSKAGATVAKQVAVELELSERLAQTLPLDAVRRLTTLADQLDGSVIEAVGGDRGGSRTQVDAAADLRSIASKITDAYDEKKISPAGSLLRSNWTGTVRVTGKPLVEVGYSNSNPFVARAIADELKGEDGLRVFIGPDGKRHATFARVEVVDESARDSAAGLANMVALQSDGGLELRYRRDGSPVLIKLPVGTWSFEGDTPEIPDEPGASAEGGPETPPNFTENDEE